MRRKQIGVMDFHGSVDITDPCYEKDIWCRMNDVKIKAGTYDDSAVEQIFSTLQIELDKARVRYTAEGGRSKKHFSLSENYALDTISYPHITMPLPDGTSLRAVAYAEDTYPAINLYLLQDGQPEELICFAEYNIGQEANRELCIGVYSSDEDDTKYYEPYQAERNTDYERNSAEAADD